jgi:hypothetical protein
VKSFVGKGEAWIGILRIKGLTRRIRILGIRDQQEYFVEILVIL